MFSYQPCELRWPFLRGIKTLSSLFDKSNAGNVSDVFVIPGHVAILLHGSSLLCMFDAVPTEHQITEIEQKNLAAFLSKPPSAGGSEEWNSDLKGLAPLFLISLHNSPVRSIWFEKSKRQQYLSLFACQQDGYLSCWVWLPQKWTWQQVGKRILLPPTRDLTRSEPVERVITNVLASKYGTKRKQLLVWCETYRSLLKDNESTEKKEGEEPSKEILALDERTRLCWCEITAVPPEEPFDDKKSTSKSTPPPASIALGRSTFADTIDEDVEKAFVSKDGVWLITQSTLYHWPFLTRTLVPKSLKLSEGTILAASLHSITQELLLLDSMGQLFLCTLEETVNKGSPSLNASLGGTGSSGLIPVLKSSKKDWVTELGARDKASLLRSSSSAGGLLRRKFSISMETVVKCQGLLKSQKEVTAGSILDFCVHQHVAIIVMTESCKFFDLRTGIFLEEQLMPKSLTGDGGIKGSARQGGVVKADMLPFAPKVNKQGGLWKVAAQGMEASSVGLWATGGMWLIQMPKVVRHAEAVAQAPLGKRGTQLLPMAGSNATDAALLCKDWGLARWNAKYLFDEAINARARQKGVKKLKGEKEKETTTKSKGVVEQQQQTFESDEGKLIRKVCEDLLPYLENPSLVVGLLAPTPEHRPYVIQELTNYLEKTKPNYPSESEGGAIGQSPMKRARSLSKGRAGFNSPYPLKYEHILSSEAEREQRRQAFHYYTPLNRKIQPLLSRYLELSVQMNAKNLPDASANSPLSSSSSSSVTLPSSSSFSAMLSTRAANLKKIHSLDVLHKLSRAEMESLEADQPALLLERMQQFLLPPNFEEETQNYNQLLASEGKEGGGVAEILLGRWLSSFTHSPPNMLLYHPEETLESCFAHMKDQENDRLQRIRLQASHHNSTVLSSNAMLLGSSFKPSSALFSFRPEEEDEEDPTDAVGDPRPKAHPYFEIMCRLYFREKPELLCPFVKLVTHFAGYISSPSIPSFFGRAVAAIPPVVFSSFSSNHHQLPYLSSKSKQDMQLRARVELLCWNGRSEAAVRMLLKLGKWQSAVEILEKRIGKYDGRRRRVIESVSKGEEQKKNNNKRKTTTTGEKEKKEKEEKEKEKEQDKEEKEGEEKVFIEGKVVEVLERNEDEMYIDVGADEGGPESLNHFELFHVLLTHCLELKDPKKLEECWTLMPQSFGVFDLLRLTRLAENKSKRGKTATSSSYSSTYSIAAGGSSSSASSSASSSSIALPSGSMLPSYSSIFVKDNEEDEEDKTEEEEDVSSDTHEDEDEADEEDEEEEENEFTIGHFRPQLLAMFRRMKLPTAPGSTS